MSLNVQGAKGLTIPEGTVKTIHDKDNRLLWGAVGYSTKYEGDAYQQTYSGKNLLSSTHFYTGSGYYNATVGTQFSAGTSETVTLTWSGDTLSVACTSTWRGAIFLAKVEEGKTYHVYGHQSGNGARTTLYALDSTYTVTRALGNAAADDFTRDGSVTIETGEVYLALAVGCGNPATTITLEKPQIELGSTYTGWEQFYGGVPSPNPDFPQNIQVVTGEQTVKVTGKNLLPLVNQSFSQGSLHYSVDAGKLKMAGSRNVEVQKNALVFKNSFSFKLAAGTYTVSCTETGSYSGTIKLYLLNKADDSTLVAITKNGSNSLTLAQETEIYLGIYSYQLTITDSVLYALQIEQGFAPSTYEPFQGQTFPISLGSIELCGIGKKPDGTYTYQDYIWEDGDTWKVHKEISKYTLNGSESWENWAAGSQTNTMAKRVPNFPTGIVHLSNTDSPVGKIEDSHFQLYAQNVLYSSDIEGIATNTGNLYVRINKARLASVDSTGLKTWFSTHNTTVYYALATPTDTAITDTNLINQLEAIDEWCRRAGYEQTVISVAPNLPLIVSRELI